MECKFCKEVKYHPPYKASITVFCNRKCKAAYMKTQTGERAAHWKGGKIYDSGYVLLFMPKHPFADNKGYVREHRIVMERHIGRYLTEDEIVHHLDEDKSNNDISNLVITNHSEHVRVYHPENQIKATVVAQRVNRKVRL